MSISHGGNYAAATWSCDAGATSASATCAEGSSSGTGAAFSVTIPPGGYVTIKGSGSAQPPPVALSVTAGGVTKNLTIGSAPPDLPGTQEAMLCSADGCTPNNINFDLAKDTVILTHGLQPSSCKQGELWTGFTDIPTQAGKLISDDLGANANVLQFFWKGACQGMTASGYIDARKNVYHAAEQLAGLLGKNISVMYTGKVQFIGHSLGTAVNAYAANMFLKKAVGVTDAQVTILDYPNNKRVSKILGMSDKNANTYGFDKNFFASTLPVHLDRSGYSLLVDNYYSEESGFDTKVANWGVGSPINGPFYNHHDLKAPHTLDGLFLDAEGVANDHSGVHQWYRWTVRPNEQENFEGTAVCAPGWNNKPVVNWINPSDRTCNNTGCRDLGAVLPSLNPCEYGWKVSMLNNPGNFPSANGDDANITSSWKVENKLGYAVGCYQGVTAGSYVCEESLAPAAPGVLARLSGDAAPAAVEEIPPAKLYAEIDVTVPAFVRTLSFDYTFNAIGDGDYVYLFANGVAIWKMSGEGLTAGELMASGPVPLRMAEGQGKLVLALYGVGEKNAEFQLENLTFTSVFDTDGDTCADDEDLYPNDPGKCIEKPFPWSMFLPAINAKK
ncbi:MAG: alpha/beta hydrolase family protein [Desulfobulbaceae bacterium]